MVPITEQSPSYPGWRVVFASSTGVFVSFASLLVYTFGIFLKPFASEFGWSRQSVSLAFGIAAMTVAVCSPFLGYLFDRYPPKRIILPCLTIFGCAFASLSLLNSSLWRLYAIFIVLGIVGNGTAQMAYSRAVSTWFNRRRGLALAILMSGGAVGSILWPPLAQWLIHEFSWRSACVVLGATVLMVGLPPVALFLRERPGFGRGTNNDVTGVSVGGALRSRMFWIIVTVLFCSSVSQNGAITHLSALLTDRGVSSAGGAIAISALGAASLIGRLATGLLLDRFFAPRVSFALLAAAAFGTFLLSGAHSVAVGAIAAALIGLGMGGEADIIPYLLTRYFGLRSFSMLYGFTWTAYAIAGAVGPVLMGKAFDATGSYQSFLVKLAIFAVSSAALMLWLPKYFVNDAELDPVQPQSALIT